MAVLAAAVAFCLGGLTGAWVTARESSVDGLDRAPEVVDVGAAEPVNLQAMLVVRDLLDAIERGDADDIRATFTADGLWGGFRVDGSDGQGGVDAALALHQRIPKQVLSGPVAGASGPGGLIPVTVSWVVDPPATDDGSMWVEHTTYHVTWDGSRWLVRYADLGWS